MYLGFFVWNPKSGFPTVTHTTRSKAIAESERLARANPGEQFFVMAPVGVSAVEKPSIYKSFEDDHDEMPF